MVPAVECGAAAQLGWEMRKRGPSIGSCASTVDVRGCRVQGGPMIVSIAHGFRKRSRVCVWTPRASVRLPSVREQRRHERADAGW